MKDGQKGIYYITADGYGTARNSPHLEVFDKHGLEVLLLADPIDECWSCISPSSTTSRSRRS